MVAEVRKNSRRFGPFLACLLLCAVACAAEEPAAQTETRIYPEVPGEIEPDARYLFYLHGAIIEREGVRPTHPKFGTYEYQKILDEFVSRGFVVISEVRSAGTEVTAYAATVVEQVRTLLAAGVAPEQITVVGFSKGGAIAIFTSSLLANNRVNFVFIGACGDWLGMRTEIVPRGRMLSLREASDDLVGSCVALFARSPEDGASRELTFELGGGHGAFYRPRPEWVDPVVEWARASAP